MPDHPTPEELLRQSERRFQALLEKSWDAVSLLAADGTILYASPSTTRVLGYDPAERVGHHAFSDIHADDLGRIQQHFARLLDSPGGSVTASFRRRHKDGSWRWFEATGTNLLAEPGIAAIVVNYHDITGHVEQARQLAEADRHKDEFLAVLAHELRNPLGSMRNAIHFLQEQGPRTPELQRANDLLDRQVQHLTGLVDDLLDLSRVRHGKIALRKEVVELAVVVARALETSREVQVRPEEKVILLHSVLSDLGIDFTATHVLDQLDEVFEKLAEERASDCRTRPGQPPV